MNDSRTSAYGQAHNPKATHCTRPRGLPCACGLPKAVGLQTLNVPQRNTYRSRRASSWTGKMVHTCNACGVDFAGEHAAAFHTCPGPDTHPGPQSQLYGTATGRLSSHMAQFAEVGMQRAKRFGVHVVANEDYRHLEERVVAHCTDEASGFTEAMWQSLAELGRCPWDNFKPSKDIA